MDDLLALAERCEKATGPDRAIDRAIEAMREKQRGRMWRTDPDFTASLDAAMTLVPEVARNEWLVKIHRGDARAIVWLPRRTIGQDGTAVTPALALCSAALKARASQETNDG